MIIKVVQMCPINRIAFGPKPLHGILVTLCVIRILRKSQLFAYCGHASECQELEHANDL